MHTLFLATLGYALLFCANTPLSAMEEANQILPELLIVEDIFPVYTRDFINEEIRALATSGIFSVSVFSEKIVNDPDLLAKLPAWMKPAPMHHFDIMPDNLDIYTMILADWGHIGEKIAQLKHEKKYNGILVTRFRGSPEERIGKPDTNCYKYLKQYGNFYLPNCEFFRKELCEKFNFSPTRCLMCYGGVDVDAIKRMVSSSTQQKRANSISIFSACRLEPKKGILHAFAALAHIIKKNMVPDNITYTIVGDGPQRKELEEQSATLGLSNNVTFLGGRSKQEVIQLIAQSDIFLAPSYTPEDGDTEGIMNSLKETGLVAKAIAVATNHAGTPEIIEHDKTGVLAKQNNVSDLTEKLVYAMTHQDRWPIWRENLQKNIEEHFDGRKVYPQLIEILVTMIQKGDSL